MWWVVADENKTLRGITNFLVVGSCMTLLSSAFSLHRSLVSLSVSPSLSLPLLPLSPSCTQRSNGVSTFRQLKKTKNAPLLNCSRQRDYSGGTEPGNLATLRFRFKEVQINKS